VTGVAQLDTSGGSTLRDRRGADWIAILRYPLFLREALVLGGRHMIARYPAISPLDQPAATTWRS